METSTETTWLLVIFALALAFFTHSPIGNSPLVWGSAMWLLIPFQLAMDVGNAVPLIAPLAILAFLFYKFRIFESAVGEGYMLFALAAVFIVLAGI